MNVLRLPFADISAMCLVHLDVFCYHNMGALVSTESLHVDFNECVEVTMHEFADTSTLCDPNMNGECQVHVQCHHHKNVLCDHNMGALVSTKGLHAESHECVVSKSQLYSSHTANGFCAPCAFILSFYPFYLVLLSFCPLSFNLSCCLTLYPHIFTFCPSKCALECDWQITIILEMTE